MLSVQRMTPFYTSQEEFQLRLVFAYQYFSIIKGGDVFQFIPSEGKEIVINRRVYKLKTLGKYLFSSGGADLFDYHYTNCSLSRIFIFI